MSGSTKLSDESFEFPVLRCSAQAMGDEEREIGFTHTTRAPPKRAVKATNLGSDASSVTRQLQGGEVGFSPNVSMAKDDTLRRSWRAALEAEASS